MFVSKNVEITKKKNDNSIEVTKNGVTIIITNSDMNYSKWVWVYDMLRNTNEANRESYFNSKISDGTISLSNSAEVDNSTPTVELSDEEKFSNGLTSLIDFFSEFEFQPSFRFVNTLGFRLSESQKSAKTYIANYFSLIDNSYKNEIIAKMKSKEFVNILNNIKCGGTPTKHINNRFKVYYGAAGTGKTTLAQSESDNRCIVCNASMLPSDLMEDFVFIEGKPSFKPSKLWECMTNGTAITLDEINLLPFDSQRFLQGILDGKKEFDYKGNKVTIADGFKVIGTMNLAIGGSIYGLPEPLMDRAEETREFVLTADMLKSAF